MRIAIAMRSLEAAAAAEHEPESGDTAECFADFEVVTNTDAHEVRAERGDVGGDEDTVQVTVVLRGRRQELENPALGVTQLVLKALKAQTQPEDAESPRSARRVIDAIGIAVEPACAG